jgi:type I restriction enzyme R subunit
LIEEQPKVLVQDWFKDSQSRERVKSAVQDALNLELPASYDKALFQASCAKAYDLIYDYAAKGLKWAA